MFHGIRRIDVDVREFAAWSLLTIMGTVMMATRGFSRLSFIGFITILGSLAYLNVIYFTARRRWKRDESR
jgi:hypothetical protein